MQAAFAWLKATQFVKRCEDGVRPCPRKPNHGLPNLIDCQHFRSSFFSFSGLYHGSPSRILSSKLQKGVKKKGGGPSPISSSAFTVSWCDNTLRGPISQIIWWRYDSHSLTGRCSYCYKLAAKGNEGMANFPSCWHQRHGAIWNFSWSLRWQSSDGINLAPSFQHSLGVLGEHRTVWTAD